MPPDSNSSGWVQGGQHQPSWPLCQMGMEKGVNPNQNGGSFPLLAVPTESPPSPPQHNSLSKTKRKTKEKKDLALACSNPWLPLAREGCILKGST